VGLLSVISHGHQREIQFLADNLTELECLLYRCEENNSIEIRDGFPNPLGQGLAKDAVPIIHSHQVEGGDFHEAASCREQDVREFGPETEMGDFKDVFLSGFQKAERNIHGVLPFFLVQKART
jgi:hypothetical protein